MTSGAERRAAHAAAMMTALTLFGTFLFLTYYLQTIKGYSPVIAGVAFLPLVGGLVGGANASTNALLPRIGARPLVTGGLVLGAASMVCLTQLTATSSYAGGVLPALVILGLGFGMVIAPSISTATSGVLPQDTGVASALVNTMQQVGGSIGAAALSTVALSATATYLAAHPAPAAVHGYTVAFTVSAIVFGVAAILACTLLPAQRRTPSRRPVGSGDGPEAQRT